MSLTVGLVVVAGATWAFAALLDAVFDRASMVHWDTAMADRIHRAATPAGLRIFDWITRTGSPNAMTWLTIIACVLLLAGRRLQLAIVWIAVFAGGAALETILKSVVHRTRPEYAGHYLAAGSYSFPSGHATLSFLGVAMVLYALISEHHLDHRRVRVACIGLGGVWVLLVGISRIYLGVHYPSDVLGGYTIAAAWFATAISLTRVVRHRRSAAPRRSA